MSTVVGLDVGGTRIKAVLVDESGEVVRRVIRTTPASDPAGTKTLATMADVLEELSGDPTAVGLVVPGIVDGNTGTVVESTNLDWRNLPIRDLLSTATGLPVAFGHDVRAGAMAEARWGAGRDHTGTLAFVPVGTGISAAIVGGGTHLATHPLAGEFGTVRGFSPIDGGPPVTLEDVAGGGAIARAAGLPDVQAVLIAVADGEPRAVRAWNAAIDALAQGLAWLTAITAPDVIVLGGGVALAGDALFEPLRTRLPDYLTVHPAPPLLPALLGEWAGARGAALLASGG